MIAPEPFQQALAKVKMAEIETEPAFLEMPPELTPDALEAKAGGINLDIYPKRRSATHC